MDCDDKQPDYILRVYSMTREGILLEQDENTGQLRLFDPITNHCIDLPWCEPSLTQASRAQNDLLAFRKVDMPNVVYADFKTKTWKREAAS